jgi:hypothetical protein
MTDRAVTYAVEAVCDDTCEGGLPRICLISYGDRLQSLDAAIGRAWSAVMEDGALVAVVVESGPDTRDCNVVYRAAGDLGSRCRKRYVAWYERECAELLKERGADAWDGPDTP